MRFICSLAAIPFLACAASAELHSPRGVIALQDLDVIVFVDAFDGTYEASIEIFNLIDLDEVQISFPDGPSAVFVEGDVGGFELELQPDATLEEFLTEDATGESFDLRFVLSGGAISVYRFNVSDVFGPQVNLATLPGAPTNVTLVQGSPEMITWTAPAITGDALLAGASNFDMGMETEQFLGLSALPFPTPVIGIPSPTISLNTTSFDLPMGATDEPLEVFISYIAKVGDFTPVHISGPTLNLGNTSALYLESSIDEFAATTPCSVDLDDSGSLDFGDVSAFLTAFAAGDLVVDFDDSGSLDFGDVSEFLTLFAVGCP